MSKIRSSNLWGPIAVALVVLISSVAASGGTIYFDANAAGENNALSLTDADKYLQDRLTAAEQINVYPYTESFESGFGEWANISGDDFDWTRHSGPTPSYYTGPSSAQDGTYYLYTEANYNSQKNAILDGPSFDLSTISFPRLSFWYHMYGVSMGTLAVEVSDDDGANWDTVWYLSKDQGNSWNEVVVSLSAYSGSTISIRFHGTTGRSGGYYRSDMAIDNISVYQGTPGISGYIETATGSPIPNVTVDADNSGGSTATDIYGYYLLEVPYGWSGTITLGDIDSSFEPEGRSYSNVTSDIVDENYMSAEQISVYPYTQSFESDFGGWINIGGDDFDWTRHSGPASMFSAGPSSAQDGTYYLYANGSVNYPYEIAILESPAIDISTLSSPRLSFWYHMYGWEMGTLDLEVSADDGANWNIVWSISGDQGNSWHETFVPLFAYGSSKVSVRFRAKTGYGPRSIIAIDNISVYQGSQPAISGYIETTTGSAISNVTISADNGGGYTTMGKDGFYFLEVPYGWSGTVTPINAHYTFAPAQRTYSNITSDMFYENYVVTATSSDVIIYVDANATSGIGDGSNWRNAYRYLQDALTVALDGDEIRVAQGTYIPDQGIGQTPRDREATFRLKHGVVLKGGYAGLTEQDPNVRDFELYETILSGDLNGDDPFGEPGSGGIPGDNCVEAGPIYIGETYFDLVESTNEGPDDCWIENDIWFVYTAAMTGELAIYLDSNWYDSDLAVYEGISCPPTALLTCQHFSEYDCEDFCDSMLSVTLTVTQGIQYLIRIGGPYVYSGSIHLSMDVKNDNSYHVVTGMETGSFGARGVLDGFTITGGNANGSGDHRFGGGMYNDNSSPTVTNCTFSGNSASIIGGGMCNSNSSPIVTSCTFSSNSARSHGGGGMWNSGSNSSIVTSCSFIGNSGSGMSNHNNPTVTNCTFTGNLGAGMYNEDYSSPKVTGCNFTGNSGFGMYNYNGSPTVSNCTFSGNVRGMYNDHSSPIVTGCIFTGNSTGNSTFTGGGMLNGYYSTPTVTSCTFSGNSYGGMSSFMYSRPTVSNCILWGNTASGGNEISGTALVSYSCVQGGHTGTGNIDTDPCFVQPGYWDVNSLWFDGDYHLLPDSPCIDAADNNSLPQDIIDLDGDGNTNEPIPWDLDGNARIVDGNNDGNAVVDMGAYEFFVPPVVVAMKFTSQTLNCRSEGNWVKAHLTLPEGFTVADVDPDRAAVLHSFGFESAPLYVFVNKDKLVQIEAAFEREAVCSLAGNWPQELTVVGFLTDGNIFLGTSTVRIIHPGMKVIEELAWYWLNGDCVQPDFCDRIDMNRDSLVNMLDYALLMNVNVEFVTDE